MSETAKHTNEIEKYRDWEITPPGRNPLIKDDKLWWAHKFGRSSLWAYTRDQLFEIIDNEEV